MLSYLQLTLVKNLSSEDSLPSWSNILMSMLGEKKVAENNKTEFDLLIENC